MRGGGWHSAWVPFTMKSLATIYICSNYLFIRFHIERYSQHFSEKGSFCQNIDNKVLVWAKTYLRVDIHLIWHWLVAWVWLFEPRWYLSNAKRSKTVGGEGRKTEWGIQATEDLSWTDSQMEAIPHLFRKCNEGRLNQRGPILCLTKWIAFAMNKLGTKIGHAWKYCFLFFYCLKILALTALLLRFWPWAPQWSHNHCLST